MLPSGLAWKPPGVTDKPKGRSPAQTFETPAVVQRQQHSCGGAANAAINLAALGAEPCLVTVTGNDGDGGRLMHRLRRHKVRLQYPVRDTSPTTTAKKRKLRPNWSAEGSKIVSSGRLSM